MRTIKYIVIHCTATLPSAKIEDIQKYWREKLGWKSPGYHVVIDMFGNLNKLAEYSEIVNGAHGHNKDSIHVAYVGGINKKGDAMDTRNLAQTFTMKRLITELKYKFPEAKIQGHRDFEGVKKDCPCFDVSKWLQIEGIK